MLSVLTNKEGEVEHADEDSANKDKSRVCKLEEDKGDVISDKAEDKDDKGDEDGIGREEESDDGREGDRGGEEKGEDVVVKSRFR